MATVEEIRQQTASARDLANQKRAETQQIRQKLQEQERSIPDVTSRQALATRYGGLQGRNFRQQAQEARSQINQRMQDVDAYESDVIAPYEQQIAQTESQLSNYEEKQRAIKLANDSIAEGRAGILANFGEGYAQKLAQDYIQNRNAQSEWNDKLQQAVDDFNAGVPQEDAFKGLNVDFLKKRGIVSFNTTPNTDESSAGATIFNNDLNSNNLAGLEDSSTKFNDRTLRVTGYTIGNGDVPLVSAKSINASGNGDWGGLGNISGNLNGSLVSLGSKQLDNSSNSSALRRYIDSLKKTFAQDTGQTEVPTQLSGFTTVSALQPPRGETIQITSSYTPEQYARIQDMRNLGVGDTLNQASARVGAFTGNVVTDLATPIRVNPNAGGFNQGLFVRGNPTDTIFTTPAYTQNIPRAGYETRGTINRNSNPQGNIFFEQNVPSRNVTAQQVGNFAGRVAQAGTRVAPYFIPYVGTGLYATELGEQLYPNIKERGIRRGVIQFARENPVGALGILGLGATGVFAGSRALVRPLRTAVVPRRGIQLIEESYGIGPSATRRGISYKAEQVLKVPRTYVMEDTRLKKLGRGALDLFYGDLSPSRGFKSLQPRRIQVSPTIKYRYSFESPVTQVRDMLSLRGAVRTERSLPATTRFGEFRNRNVADRSLSIRVRKGTDLTPMLSETQGKVTGGIVEQLLVPTKSMRRTQSIGNDLMLFFREEGRAGGRRVTANVGQGGLTSASLFRPTQRLQAVRAQRIPIVNNQGAGFIAFDTVPINVQGRAYDVKRFRQAGRSLNLDPFTGTLKVASKEQRGILNIAYPRNQNEMNFLPVRSDTGLPRASNILPSQPRQSVIQSIYGRPIELAEVLPASRNQIRLGAPRLASPRVSNARSGSSGASIFSLGAVAGQGSSQVSTGSTQSMLPPVTKQSNILSLGNAQMNRAQTRQSSQIRSSAFQSQGPASLVRELENVGQVGRVAQRTQTAQRTRSAQVQVLSTVQRAQSPSQIRARTTRTNPFTVPSRPIQRRKTNEGFGDRAFDVFVRRRGKDVKIGSRSNAQEASALLFGDLKSTLSASGFVSQGGRRVNLGVFGNFAPSRRDAGRVVQRRGARLSSDSERSAIRNARRQSRQFFSGFGNSDTARRGRSFRWF